MIAAVALVPVGTVVAGESHPAPPARVVAPTSASPTQLERDDLPGPELEVMNHAPRIATPEIPSFELPPTEPGLRSPRELRVRGRPWLGTEVKVKGYVTWVYDCVEVLAVANPKASRAQIQAAIHGDPALCHRPAFSLGDARDTSRDASISVVAPEPGGGTSQGGESRAGPAIPTLADGDYVSVTGRWSVPASPALHDAEGVLVWSTVERAAPAAASAGEPVAALKELEIVFDGPATVPMRKPVDDQTVNTSIEHMNACNKAIVARQYDAANAECRQATDTWDGNHLAWYAWAGAHMARREWQKAKAAIERAVMLRPDQAMYQLYYGIALYEAAHQKVRGDQARKDRKKPETGAADPSTPRLEAARDALATAVRLAPELWRAHYYLGRVYRELDDARHAAMQFSATIRTYPGYRFAYVALIELYRRWDYIDQALAVAVLGTASVLPAEAADLWFEIGIIHDAKHADDKAIEAFGNAIAGGPDDAGARFERGQIYLRKGDLASARRDFEGVARSTDPRAGVTKQLATQLLTQLAAGTTGAAPSRLPSWECSREGPSSTIECRQR
ncbi:MAG TPA: tetratricopeptide repeat protein [Kofleriaceae bacterium]